MMDFNDVPDMDEILQEDELIEKVDQLHNSDLFAQWARIVDAAWENNVKAGVNRVFRKIGHTLADRIRQTINPKLPFDSSKGVDPDQAARGVVDHLDDLWKESHDDDEILAQVKISVGKKNLDQIQKSVIELFMDNKTTDQYGRFMGTVVTELTNMLIMKIYTENTDEESEK